MAARSPSSAPTPTTLPDLLEACSPARTSPIPAIRRRSARGRSSQRRRDADDDLHRPERGRRARSRRPVSVRTRARGRHRALRAGELSRRARTLDKSRRLASSRRVPASAARLRCVRRPLPAACSHAAAPASPGTGIEQERRCAVRHAEREEEHIVRAVSRFPDPVIPQRACREAALTLKTLSAQNR